MGAASGYKNSFNPQFLTSSDRRVRQIDPLRDATMLKMLDEIARDDTFRIEGMKKGTEKAVFENVNIFYFFGRIQQIVKSRHKMFNLATV